MAKDLKPGMRFKATGGEYRVMSTCPIPYKSTIEIKCSNRKCETEFHTASPDFQFEVIL